MKKQHDLIGKPIWIKRHWEEDYTQYTIKSVGKKYATTDGLSPFKIPLEIINQSEWWAKFFDTPPNYSVFTLDYESFKKGLERAKTLIRHTNSLADLPNKAKACITEDELKVLEKIIRRLERDE